MLPKPLLASIKSRASAEIFYSLWIPCSHGRFKKRRSLCSIVYECCTSSTNWAAIHSCFERCCTVALSTARKKTQHPRLFGKHKVSMCFVRNKGLWFLLGQWPIKTWICIPLLYCRQNELGYILRETMKQLKIEWDGRSFLRLSSLSSYSCFTKRSHGW